MLEIAVVAYNIAWGLINGYNLYPITKNKLSDKKSFVDEDSDFHAYVKKIDEEKLPTISTLLPAYHEEKTIEHAITNYFEMDYPGDKNELIVLLEEDDEETIEIVEKLEESLGDLNFKHYIVKETKEPRGKPRALNQGLEKASGEIVGIIDGEDIVSKDLLMKVSYAIREKNYDVVQGILDMVNDKDGWKNKQFRGEYGFRFRNLLPALANSGFPVPLGGTTSYLKKNVLEEMGGWDSYNVTEDFDLGLRLYLREYEIGAISSKTEKLTNVQLMNSVTKEESPTSWTSWLRQRTRWQRGKIQTLKKIFSNPPKKPKKKFHSFMSCLFPHLGAINLSGIAVSTAAYLSNVNLPLPVEALIIANLASIGFYSGFQAKGYLDSTRDEIEKINREEQSSKLWEEIKKEGKRYATALLDAVTLPAYWFAQWTADLRAMKQEYIDKDFFWEKTEHKGRHIEKK